MITHKRYALTVIKQFVVFVQTQCNITIKPIRIDNAYEMGSSNEGILFYNTMWILHQKSTPFAPHQNGFVEFQDLYISNQVWRVLIGMNVLKLLCISLIECRFIHLVNKTTFELLYKKQPDLSNLKVFGCLCFITSSILGCDKFMYRAQTCILIGYLIQKKSYRFINLTTKERQRIHS